MLRRNPLGDFIVSINILFNDTVAFYTLFVSREISLECSLLSLKAIFCCIYNVSIYISLCILPWIIKFLNSIKYRLLTSTFSVYIRIQSLFFLFFCFLLEVVLLSLVFTSFATSFSFFFFCSLLSWFVVVFAL